MDPSSQGDEEMSARIRTYSKKTLRLGVVFLSSQRPKRGSRRRGFARSFKATNEGYYAVRTGLLAGQMTIRSE
jgi:hypothetical protein